MKFTNFIEIKKNSLSKYADDYFTICKRDGNKKREFIIVQDYLGKHVPKKPSEILKYYNSLINKIYEETGYAFKKDSSPMNSKDLNGILYFAETALCVGEALKNSLRINYSFHSTREKCNENLLMEFTEDHCHAPEHKIYGKVTELVKCRRLLIVDDEITSGNMIEKVIDKIQEINPSCEIFVASFINLMEPERIIDFSIKGIKIISLVKGNIKSEEIISGDKNYFSKNGYEDSYLVLGTEEDMYNALKYATNLEDQGYKVYFHASTRSPIIPSMEKDYSLAERYDFPSAKDPNRKVYLYNLVKYKQIFVFRNKTKESNFDEKANELLKDYSILPVKFYNYQKEI